MKINYLSTEKFESPRERIHWFKVGDDQYGLWVNELRSQDPELKLVDKKKSVLYEGHTEVSLNDPNYNYYSFFSSLIEIAKKYSDNPDFQGAAEEAKSRLKEEFYKLWERDGLGKPDFDNDDSWGVTWNWDNDFLIDIDNPKLQAHELYDKFWSEFLPQALKDEGCH